jgi:arylsulfatase A-like enzyme
MNLKQLLVAAVLSVLMAATSGLCSAAADRPNVVFIMTDDLGYGDLGVYGAPDTSTPEIDRLASQGVRLTNFYSNGPACSPTRAGFITGRYQQRVGIERPLGNPSTDDAKAGLKANGRTLPQLLKDDGYATALIGKWHLGYLKQNSPNAHGFDYFFGYRSGYIDYYRHTDGDGQPDLYENDKSVTAEGYMTDLITDRSVAYIRDRKERPFFLSVQYSAPHWPYQRPDQPSVARDNARHLQPHDQDTSTRADYVAMLERADAGVGRILAALDEAGIAGNTLVIFTNDNGGEWLSRNAPFFHRKLSLWEGGIRVPAILRWPGHLPAGGVSEQVGITMDLTATILAVTRTPVPTGLRLEGMDLMPVLSGAAPKTERTLFWRIDAYGQTQQAVRSGEWKLLVDGGASLVFNLEDDPGERRDLANQRQDIARRLRPLLDDWGKNVDAEFKTH